MKIVNGSAQHVAGLFMSIGVTIWFVEINYKFRKSNKGVDQDFAFK
jgi:hypothetical protein